MLHNAACGYYRFDVHEDTTDGDQILQVTRDRLL